MLRMELEPFIPCWKKTPRALKIHEQQHGKDIMDTPERRTDAELAFFRDPVEAAAFFCLVDLVMRAPLIKFARTLIHTLPEPPEAHYRGSVSGSATLVIILNAVGAYCFSRNVVTGEVNRPPT